MQNRRFHSIDLFRNKGRHRFAGLWTHAASYTASRRSVLADASAVSLAHHTFFEQASATRCTNESDRCHCPSRFYNHFVDKRRLSLPYFIKEALQARSDKYQKFVLNSPCFHRVWVFNSLTCSRHGSASAGSRQLHHRTGRFESFECCRLRNRATE